MNPALETQMIARLRAGEAALGWQWRTLETYPADWDAFLAEKKGQINPPGAWLGFAGTRSMTLTSSHLVIDGVFGLTVMARNKRTEQARRHGTDVAGEVGSYQLMAGALGLLCGWTPAAATRAIQPGRVRHVRPVEQLRAEKASMMAAELFVQFEVPLAFLDAGDDAFETFHANWEMPPVSITEIPADVQADATDEVELPQ